MKARRLVELDQVDAEGLQLARLLVQQPGKRHGHVGAPAVVGVGDGVADGHGPRQGELEAPFRVRPGEARLLAVHRLRAPHRAGHGRHLDDVAVVADAHLGLPGPVDALDRLEEAVHEVGAELLAVADDVDAAVLLLLEPDQGGVLLAPLELGALQTPGRPQLLGLGQPGRLGQAACDRRVQHVEAPPDARMVGRKPSTALRRAHGAARGGARRWARPTGPLRPREPMRAKPRERRRPPGV
jgi:hypothetical protein